MITAQEANRLAAIGQEAANHVNTIGEQIQQNPGARHLHFTAPPHLIPRIQEYLLYKGYGVTVTNPSELTINW